MKLKKYNYLIILILTLVVGINKTYADNNCYYMSEDKETLVSYNTKRAKFVIEQRGKMPVDSFKEEPLINNGVVKVDSSETGITVEAITKGTCPTYIVYRHKSRFMLDSDGVWGFNNKSQANTFYTNSKQINNMSAWLLSYKNENGAKYTDTQFYEQERKNSNSSSGLIGGTISGSNVSGDKASINCNELFGSKNDPESLRYLINEILMYIRIIGPLLLLVLGVLDFAKAIIASKEDQMKKAQATFIKRVIAAIGIFFVPLLVDIIMGLADIVWKGTGYYSCGL